MAKELKDYPSVSLKESDIDGIIDFEKLFGRKSEVHIEIGSGKGTFLVNEAVANPDADYLGIEWANKFYRHCVDRVGRWHLGNVRVIRTDAGAFIGEYLGDGTVDRFHIYFPDPWPKKRHHKRRMIGHNNMAEFVRCLKSGGVIRAATDHEGYFEQMCEVLRDERYGLREIDFESCAGAESGEFAGTNFERKYIKEQRSINAIAMLKE